MNKEQRAALRKLAEEATPQNIDTALVIHECDGQYIECPVCGGDGSVELEGDYCNFDGQAIGVQFYGIGKAHGAAEAYYRAANPATILQLLDYIETLEKDAARWNAVSALMFIGDVECKQDDEGGYGISVDPVENIIGKTFSGDTPEEAIDAAMQGETE